MASLGFRTTKASGFSMWIMQSFAVSFARSNEAVPQATADTLAISRCKPLHKRVQWLAAKPCPKPPQDEEDHLSAPPSADGTPHAFAPSSQTDRNSLAGEKHGTLLDHRHCRLYRLLARPCDSTPS